VAAREGRDTGLRSVRFDLTRQVTVWSLEELSRVDLTQEGPRRSARLVISWWRVGTRDLMWVVNYSASGHGAEARPVECWLHARGGDLTRLRGSGCQLGASGYLDHWGAKLPLKIGWL
jgi:hypothetical protein